MVDVLNEVRASWRLIAATYRRRIGGVMLVQLGIMLGVVAMLFVAMRIAHAAFGPIVEFAASDPTHFSQRVTAMGLLVGLGIALLTLPVQGAGAFATMQLADLAIGNQRSRIRILWARAVRQLFATLGVLVLGSALAIAAFVAAPFISAVGLLWWLGASVRFLGRSRRGVTPPQLPYWQETGAAWRMAIPFYWFGVATAWFVLALPAVALETRGIKSSFNSARELARGRVGRILLVTASVVAAMWLVLWVTAWSAEQLGGLLAAAITSAIVQLAALPLILIAAVAMYRRAGGSSEAAPMPAVMPRRAWRLGRFRASGNVAALIIWALGVSLLAVPMFGTAATAEPGITITVNSPADQVDETQLLASIAACETASAGCTLRGAAALAEELILGVSPVDPTGVTRPHRTPTGAASIRIDVDVSSAIELKQAVAFDLSTATSQGLLTVDGNGAVVDGGYNGGLFNFVGEWLFTVTDMTLTRGSAGSGGAIFSNSPSLTVTNSSLLDNISSTGGGGIVSYGNVTVRNSTLSGNRAAAIDGGSDIWFRGNATLINSTLIEADNLKEFNQFESGGSAIRGGAGSSLVLKNSIVLPHAGTGLFTCSGTAASGSGNVLNGDNSCSGAQGVAVTQSSAIPQVVTALDWSGRTPVHHLASDRGDLRNIGVDCPAADQLGYSRATPDGCDPGAVEVANDSSIALKVSQDSVLPTSASFIATVTGSVSPEGAVEFTWDGGSSGPVQLDSYGSASWAASNLTMRNVYTVTARYTSSNDLNSAQTQTSHTPMPVPVPVSISCAVDPDFGSAFDPCAVDPAVFAGTDEVLVSVRVADDRAGEVVLTFDGDLASPISTTVSFTGTQTQTIVVDLNQIDADEPFAIHAHYVSLDTFHEGTAVLTPQVKRGAQASVSAAPTGTTGAYGDASAGRVDVTVSGDQGIPTGRVRTVFTEWVALDAAGKAALDVSQLPPAVDPAQVVVVYEGDSAYGPAKAAAFDWQTFSGATVAQVVGVSSSSVQVGAPMEVTVAVHPAAGVELLPAGSVGLYVNGVLAATAFVQSAAADAEASYFVGTIPGHLLSTPPIEISARFVGAAGFSDANSAAVLLSVNADPTQTTVQVVPATPTWGDQVTLTATVTPTNSWVSPGGVVTFYNGDTVLGMATVVDCSVPDEGPGCGVATLTVAAALVPGPQQLTALFGGSPWYLTSQGDVSFTIERAEPQMGLSVPTSGSAGESLEVSVWSEGSGPKLPDGHQLRVLGQWGSGPVTELGTVTLADGSGSVAITVPYVDSSQTLNITLESAQTELFEAHDWATSLTISPTSVQVGWQNNTAPNASLDYGQTVNLTAQLTTLGLSGVVPQGDVVFSWRGTEIGRVPHSSLVWNEASGTYQATTTSNLVGSSKTAAGTGPLTVAFEGATGFTSSHAMAEGSATVLPVNVKLALQVQPVALGQTVQATATVSQVAGSLGDSVTGQVVFTVDGAETVPVPLVDGVATLPASFVSTVAGPVNVTATYSPFAPQVDSRFTYVDFDNYAFNNSFVGWATAQVTASASEAAWRTRPVQVEVQVQGVLPANGTVWLVHPVSNEDASARVALQGGTATLVVADSANLSLGTHEYLVAYSGSPVFNAAQDVTVSFTVVAIPAEVSITPNHSSTSTGQIYDAFVGADSEYRVTVTAPFGTPEGQIQFRVNDQLVSTKSLTGGAATFEYQGFNAPADATVEAIFVASSPHATSSRTIEFAAVSAPVVVSVDSFTATVGQGVTVNAVVRTDLTAYPDMLVSAWPNTAPTGSVQVSLSDGSNCWVSLSDAGAQESAGTCLLVPNTAGTKTLTATYSTGGFRFVSAAPAESTIFVGKNTPSLVLSAPSSGIGGETVPLSWNVVGPDSGQVEVRLGSNVLCSATALQGSCDAPLPSHLENFVDREFSLHYLGTDDWDAATSTKPLYFKACVPFGAVTMLGAGSLPFVVSPAPNCGNGFGYVEGTQLSVAVEGSATHRVDAFRPAMVALPDATFTQSVVAVTDVVRRPNGGAQVYTDVEAYSMAGNLVPIGFEVVVGGQCTTVRLDVSGAGLTHSAISTSGQGCAVAPTILNSVTKEITVRIGTQLTVLAANSPRPDHTFYGWRDLNTDQTSTARSAQFQVSAGPGNIRGYWGTTCDAATPTVVQPTGATISLTLPVANCNDPVTGESGYQQGTTVEASITFPQGTTIVPVTQLAQTPGGQRYENTLRVVAPISRHFLQAWDVAGAQAESTWLPAWGPQDPRSPASIRFELGSQPMTVSANVAECVQLTMGLVVGQDQPLPANPTASPAPNCPGVNALLGWYVKDTVVSVTAGTPARGVEMLGWTVNGARSESGSAMALKLESDTVLSANYGRFRDCRNLDINTYPAGALAATWTIGDGSDPCAALTGGKYNQGTDGASIVLDISRESEAAQGAEIVIAYATRDREGNQVSSLWNRSPQFADVLWGDSAILAYACHFVEVNASVQLPDGRAVSGASNMDPFSHTELRDFVLTPSADCSIGADPHSGTSNYAWQSGQDFAALAVADSEAYRFLGWRGDVTGTDASSPTLPLTGVGRYQTDPFHFSLTADFEAICYRLGVPYDADGLEILTEPNCPGMDAAQRMYLGGTQVVVHAADYGDSLFRNWVSGTDHIDPDDQRWVTVRMDDNKDVIAYYSERSAGEYLSHYGTKVGDQLAVGSKKLVGMATTAVSVYAASLLSKVTLVASGLAFVASGLEAVGLGGAVADGIRSTANVMSDLMTFVFAPLDCMGVWAAGGDDTVMYAAQNAFGTAFVMAAKSGSSKTAANGQQAEQGLKTRAKSVSEDLTKAKQAAAVLLATRDMYDAASDGRYGWEGSAHDAWVSQESRDVMNQCMMDRMGATALRTVATIDSIGG